MFFGRTKSGSPNLVESIAIACEGSGDSGKEIREEEKERNARRVRGKKERVRERNARLR